MSGKPLIVNVSRDFPDCFESAKTSAVQSLIDLTLEEFDHHVFSLNRRSPGWSELIRDCAASPLNARCKIEQQPFRYGQALIYRAPGLGLYHASMLEQVGDYLVDQISSMPSRPDLLVGHKLSIEGLIVERVARKTGIPYALSLQGDTDTKILKYRPDLRPRLSRIYHGAKVTFPFAPWTEKDVERVLGARQGPGILLPCVTNIDHPLEPVVTGDGLVTVFHLKNARRKNLQGLVTAMRTLGQERSGAWLGVVGGGSDADWKAARGLVGDTPCVRLEGGLAREEVRQRMNRAAGFVLPSLRESFGMVFVEALYSGLPIIYPAGTAIDGYLDALPFAIRVDARNAREIAAAMVHLLDNESQLKSDLSDWFANEGDRPFQNATIANDYARGLRIAIDSPDRRVGPAL